MIRKFRSGSIITDGDVNPFAVLTHQLEILDQAAELARKEENLEALLEISERIGLVNSDYVNIMIHLVLGGDEEDEEKETENERKFGFTVGVGDGDPD